jgi:glycosyltransferase involved in cell wall biosynthesis
MRILFLSDFCPWPLDNGYRLRIFHLIDALASRHDVTLASVVPDSTTGAFAPAAKCTRFVPLSDGDCAFRGTDRFERWAPLSQRVETLLTSSQPNVVARWRSPRILQTLKELAAGTPFDLVWTERVNIAELAREAGFRNIVVDLPDIESVALARVLRNYPWYWSKPLHWLEWAKLFVYEQLMPYRFAGLTVCKDDDRTFFATRRSRVTVVPNGVADFSPSAEPPPTGSPEMLFIGALNFESNIDAIRFFKTAVLPLVRNHHPNARLIAVGRDPIDSALALHDGSQCELVENVDDLDPYFDRAAIFVAPIRLGSGTRLKVLEALARGKAVVAPTVAAEGLDL